MAESQSSAADEIPQTMRRTADVIGEYLTALDKRQQGESHHKASGFMTLDKRFGGWLHDGHLIIVAGRPGMGKSALAQQIGENVAASHDRTVAFFSLEMSAYELIERSVSRRTGIGIPALKTGVISDGQWPELSLAAAEIASWPFLIDDASFDINGLVTKVKATAERLKKDGEPPLGLIVVDYLQLVAGKAANRTLEIGQISGALKRLAKELSVPVVALSQLNRGVEGRNDKRPSLSDLRESGSIEQDADLVLFVYRDEYYDEKSKDRGTAEIIAGKNRHGETGMVRLSFLGERVRFGDLLASYVAPVAVTKKGAYRGRA